MNGVQTRFKCKLDVKRCKRFVFPPSSLLPRSNALKTKAIRYFQTDRTLTRIVSPPLHASSQPKVATENCIGCNICVKHCAHDAIHLNAERKAEIDYTKCVGCGQCVALCQHDAAVVSDWDTSERLNYKIAEYSVAVLKDKPHFHISFIMNVSPECDCWNHNDAAIIPDLGMLASADPVALDKACADLVIQAPVLHSDNVLAKKHEHEDLCGCDKFHMIHPDTDWLAGLRHAEKIGLGTMDYELIKI